MVQTNQLGELRIPAPQYRNSAGRLLAALQVTIPGGSYVEWLAPGAGDVHHLTVQTTQVLSELRTLYDEFVEDVQKCSGLEKQEAIILNGTEFLRTVLYPTTLGNELVGLNKEQVAVLEFAAVMLPQQGEISEGDFEAIQTSLSELDAMIREGDLTSSTRKILRDIVGLTERALRWHDIHGPRSLKKAVKEMLAELMELYVSKKAEEDSIFKKALGD